MTALLAVITGLPWSMAFRIRLRAGSKPPMSSITASISGSDTIPSRFVVRRSGGIATCRGLSRERTPTAAISTACKRG
jgi:hypothetical protein